MYLNPYLHFNGTCEAAFQFYEKVLGGKIVAMIPHAGTPAEGHVPPEWRDKIMHARLIVGDEVVMVRMRRRHKEAAFKGFSAGAQESNNGPRPTACTRRCRTGGRCVSLPIQQTFWAARFGMLVDAFGSPG